MVQNLIPDGANVDGCWSSSGVSIEDDDTQEGKGQESQLTGSGDGRRGAGSHLALVPGEAVCAVAPEEGPAIVTRAAVPARSTRALVCNAK